MDPITVPTLAAAISALVGGAAGQAGKTAWDSLAALVRRTLGADDDSSDRNAIAALETVEQQSDDAASAELLAETLVDRAQADPAFADLLSSWATRAAQITQERPHVSNVISGRVQGAVVQARDVSGSINVGDSRPG